MKIGKNKKKKAAKDKRTENVMLPDVLDDLGRDQIEPVEEPLPEDQDERWAFLDGDPRQAISTAADKRNGAE